MLPMSTTHPTAHASPATSANSSPATEIPRTTGLQGNLRSISQSWQSMPDLIAGHTEWRDSAGSTGEPRLPPWSEGFRHAAPLGPPPSYWANSEGDPCYPPGPHDAVEQRRVRSLEVIYGQARPGIGDVASIRLSQDLSGVQRDRAVTHRNNIALKLDALTKIAERVRDLGIDVSAGPVNFFPLANSLKNLSNAWSRGDLVDSSRFIRIVQSPGNAMRKKLEGVVGRETERLSRRIFDNIPDRHVIDLLLAMGEMRGMKV